MTSRIGFVSGVVLMAVAGVACLTLGCAHVAEEAALETTPRPCTRLAESVAIYRALLDDIERSYTNVGGGGISLIDSKSPGQLVVELPQDERIDLLTYEVSVDEHCHATIVRKTPGVISVGPS